MICGNQYLILQSPFFFHACFLSLKYGLSTFILNYLLCIDARAKQIFWNQTCVSRFDFYNIIICTGKGGLFVVDIDLSAVTLSIEEIFIRFGIAMLIGALIGIEREFSHRPAGLRTHILVALGSCAVMLTSQMIFCQYRVYGATADPARLSAQVIAGVGFLGAGTILREGAIVKGLTTAASVWMVACLGIAVGAGYYEIGLIGTAYILITLTFLERFQHKVFRNKFNRYTISLKCKKAVPVLEKATTLVNQNDARMDSIHIEEDNQGICTIIFNTDFAGRRALKRHNAFLFEMTEDPNVISVSSEKIVS